MTPGDLVAATDSETIRNHAAFIWSVADLLRGDYKQSEYGRVICPPKGAAGRRSQWDRRDSLQLRFERP